MRGKITGQPKVAQFQSAVIRKKDVCRFQISVNDIGFVQVL